MTDRHRIPLSELPTGRPTQFVVEPGTEERAAIADRLGIPSVRKLRFEGEMQPQGRQDWALAGRLGATVVQPCVVTLDPVTTRIDEDVRRTYLAEMPEPEGGDEAEMPEDDTADPLPETLDLFAVMEEALALALPPFPRAPGAELGEAVYTEPGKAAMTDDDAKPFAGLKALRDKLGDDG
jgi:uncharacterized metal-binding protein YceD (DUF177 family)